MRKQVGTGRKLTVTYASRPAKLHDAGNSPNENGRVITGPPMIGSGLQTPDGYLKHDERTKTRKMVDSNPYSQSKSFSSSRPSSTDHNFSTAIQGVS